MNYDDMVYHCISFGQDILFHLREKLSAVCDTNASQNNQNLSLW